MGKNETKTYIFFSLSETLQNIIGTKTSYKSIRQV